MISNTEKSLSSDCISKWVKNCSDRLLSDPELKVLAKGLNFAVTPKKIPIVDYVTATESACRNLGQSEAEELRSRVNNILKKHRKPEPNIYKAEERAINDLRKDKNIKILPADKGKCALALNTADYISKCDNLLNDEKTYIKLKGDPTAKYEWEMVSILRDLKSRNVLTYAVYHKIYPTTEAPQNFMDYLRFIKTAYR